MAHPAKQDPLVAKMVLKCASRSATELRAKGLPRTASAIVLMAHSIAALGQHTPGWSGSISNPLTRRALGGLH
ncbi:MAG: hypothetical protein KF718_16925 [Polyangiaceae bacterium]|nr:hypothetical protein [Polyangiaceae bacterium]